MNTRYLKTLLTAAAALLGSACIENDVPYPVVEISIADIEGEGFTVGATDPANRTITLALDEQTDIRKVRIDKVDYDVTIHSVHADKETFIRQIASSVELVGTHDMRTPLTTTLSLYQDYTWTIRAEQRIALDFRVKGQIKEAEIDTQARTATAFVPDGTDLAAVRIETLKLGPAEVTTYSPTVEELSAAGFAEERKVRVTCHGETEEWTLRVQETDIRMAVQEIDLWNNTATVTAFLTEEEAKKAEVQYRSEGAESWQTARKEGYDDGILRAIVEPGWQESQNKNGLTVYTMAPEQGIFAGHTYELRLLVGDEEYGMITQTTAAGHTIPDGDLEDGTLSCFTKDNETEEQVRFWGSGNNLFKPKLCTQGEFGGSKCAYLQASKTLGILASGNFFSGLFHYEGMNGTVKFGQPYAWESRPRAMKVRYYAPTIGTVDVAKYQNPGNLEKGDQDMSRIMVAIVDWSDRHEVTSGVGQPSGMWDPEETMRTEEGAIIAYGSKFIDAASTGDAWIDLELPLSFYDTAAKPGGKISIVISCSTSAYGDFMVGCSQNRLYLDDFGWIY